MNENQQILSHDIASYLNEANRLPKDEVNGWKEAVGLGIGVSVYSYISSYSFNATHLVDDLGDNKGTDLLAMPANNSNPYMCNDSFEDTLIIDDGAAEGLNSTSREHRNYRILTKMVNMITLTVILGLIILITIIGNVFVIAAIILERNLQNVGNYLVASLAVADLFVACLVMPLGAVYEISQGWILGPELCDIWTSCDVLCCTASILHLVAIAVDRYWTVTNIDYNNLRTPRRVFFMIFCVWSAAIVVSLAPQFGWKDPEYIHRIEQQKCMVSQDVAYQIFATCCTFYAPLLIILCLYWKIYQIARKRIQRRTIRQFRLDSKAIVHDNSEADVDVKKDNPNHTRRFNACFDKGLYNSVDVRCGTTLGVYPRNSFSIAHTREETDFSTSNFDSKSHAGTEVTDVDEVSSIIHFKHEIQLFSISLDGQVRVLPSLDISTVSLQVAGIHSHNKIALTPTSLSNTEITQKIDQPAKEHMRRLGNTSDPHQKLAKRRQLLEAKRERKAAQTLAIITGAFAVCWLPFFVMVLLLTLCKECHIHAAVASIFLWLGYFNSTLNPIIYTIFNPEFRRSFQRMLFGRKRYPMHQRSGKI